MGFFPKSTPSRGFLKGRELIYPLSLIICVFFLWGFSYGLLDVLNKHFQVVLEITKLQSTGLQVVYFGGGYLLFSPVAAEVMRRKGYRITILMGLSLYSLGAIFFWPTAHFSNYDHRMASFGGFCACTFVIACGLATLETSANSYAVVIGDPTSASIRLQFCQSWNGVASFIGPLIASKCFFSGANANNLVNVQFVYLAVACAAILMAIAFCFAKLPEISKETLYSSTNKSEMDHEVAQGPLWKQYNMIFGFLAQFCYVGAQVSIASFFLNYATENANFKSATASNLLSYSLMTFTFGRFIATYVATIFQADFLLMVFTLLTIALNTYVCIGIGRVAVGILVTLFFFMGPMYGTIFTLGTANLGRHTHRGAGILVMGVSGGALFPPIQGVVADAINTRISYVIPLMGFAYVLGYATFHWLSHGMRVIRPKDSDEESVAKVDVQQPGDSVSQV